MSWLDRLKPRASARTQAALAGAVWLAVASILAYRGVGWSLASAWPLALLAGGIVLGLLKGRFLLDPVARRAVARIRERGADSCAGGFFSWQSWLLALGMMAGGHALRLSSIPRPVLGVLYVAISTGLAWASRTYLREAFARAS